MAAQQSERLLAYLKDSPLLDGYCLSIYLRDRETAPDKTPRCLCGTLGIPHLCHEICVPSLNVAIEDALRSRKSVLFRCPLGLFSFAVPVSSNSCLVCGGVRENLFDLYFCESEQFESMKGKQKLHPYEVLEQLEKFPVFTEKEVRDTMLKVEGLVVSFSSCEGMQSIDYDTEMQHSFKNVAAAIVKAESFNEALRPKTNSRIHKQWGS